MRRDPVIIGAGPAGTAAAIMLARAGHQPILIERTAGPTDKVCGDFLSQDTIKRAQLLGVDPTALGAAPIRRVRLIHGERAVDAALPFPALGLSRRALDSALLRQAAKAGAILQTGQTVRRLTHDGNQWSILTDTILTAETVFLATGKHDLRDAPRPHTERDAVGMKMYFELAPEPARALDGTIELTLFPGRLRRDAGCRSRPNRAVYRRRARRIPGLWRWVGCADRRDRARQPSFCQDAGRRSPIAAPTVSGGGYPLRLPSFRPATCSVWATRRR